MICYNMTISQYWPIVHYLHFHCSSIASATEELAALSQALGWMPNKSYGGCHTISKLWSEPDLQCRRMKALPQGMNAEITLGPDSSSIIKFELSHWTLHIFFYDIAWVNLRCALNEQTQQNVFELHFVCETFYNNFAFLTFWYFSFELLKQLVIPSFQYTAVIVPIFFAGPPQVHCDKVKVCS